MRVNKQRLALLLPAALAILTAILPIRFDQPLDLLGLSLFFQQLCSQQTAAWEEAQRTSCLNNPMGGGSREWARERGGERERVIITMIQTPQREGEEEQEDPTQSKEEEL